MKTLRLITILLLTALLMCALTACSNGRQEPGGGEQSGEQSGGGTEERAEKSSEEQALDVFVSIPPQKYFAERVGGADVEVTVMLPPGKQPHTYEPSPRQIARLSEADIYFRIRVPFEEAFIPRIQRSLEELPITDTTAEVERRRFDPRVKGDGDEAPLDPHVWLGPEQVKTMAASIRNALTELRPERAEAYRSNYREFAADIDELDRRLAEQLAPLQGEMMFVFHPAFGYFADAYGLDQEAVEIEGDEPSPGQLEQIIQQAREENVRVIFVQPQFSEDSARRIAQAIDGAVVPIDPLAEEWMSNMERIAEKIRKGLQGDE
jgi:zinc transport system substrate-binding protein